MVWLGPPAHKGAGSKTHLKSRCCAILKRGGDAWFVNDCPEPVLEVACRGVGWRPWGRRARPFYGSRVAPSPRYVGLGVVEHEADTRGVGSAAGLKHIYVCIVYHIHEMGVSLLILDSRRVLGWVVFFEMGGSDGIL